MIARQLVLALMCTSTCVACGPTESSSLIDVVLESAVETGEIPGVIAMAANSDGIIYNGTAGMRDVSSNTEMTIDTIVHIASMTKAVTSVAVMQLAEQNKVGLDHPVGEYLPRLADVQVLDGFDADDKPILKSPETPVTVRQLLSHTSGYVYELWNRNAARYVELGGAASIFDDGDDFIDAPLAFDPGTRWEYGISTDILGILVEVVSGHSLDEYFREKIFSPLGMLDTYFILPDDKMPRLATSYARSIDGKLLALPNSEPSGNFLSGGGGLMSTAGDYIRFLRALLNNGELDGMRILNAESVDLMAQNQIGDLEAADSMISVMPGLSNDVNFMPDSKDKFGLGFLINTKPVVDGRSAGSLTWGGLYNTYFWVDRDQDICGVLMTQILPFYDSDVMELFNRFETAVYTIANAAKN